MVIENGDYCVYIHTNKVNGKMYVGITARCPEIRWGKNGSGYISCCKFWRAIKKYGWENFEHEIFAKNLTQDEASNMEKFLIEKLDAVNNGYNINFGGINGKHNPESIEKIRKANLGKVVSEETKQKIKAARANQIISIDSIMKSAEKNRGKKRTDEFKQRSREIKRSKMRPVYIVETGEVFESICDAARKFNINKSCIMNACRSKRPLTKNGLHVQFVNA